MVANFVASTLLLASAAAAIPTYHQAPAYSQASSYKPTPTPSPSSSPYNPPYGAPAQPGQSVGPLGDLMNSLKGKTGKCDLSKAKLEVPGLPQPDGKAAVVLVGRGTQNYTCNGVAPTAAPKANGALANLYDISCLMEADPTWTLYREVPKAALQLAAEHVDSREPLKLYDGAITMDLLGHHYFNDTSATTPTPVFDFHVSGDGFIAGKLEERKSIDAPANAIKGVDARGFGSVPWVQVPKRFDAEGKKAFNELWRVETAGGSPPKTCEAFPEGGEFTVEYAANYWYFD